MKAFKVAPSLPGGLQHCPTTVYSVFGKYSDPLTYSISIKLIKFLFSLCNLHAMTKQKQVFRNVSEFI